MAHPRTRAWRRAQARKNHDRKTKPRGGLYGVPFSRKMIWRRRDKLWLWRNEGYLALLDDWE